MKLTDIEGLPAIELKRQRKELVKQAADVKPAELAARYIQARTDATLRDEKLAEQGRTITALQDALAEGKKNLVQAEQRAERAERALAELQAAKSEADKKHAADLESAQAHSLEQARLLVERGAQRDAAIAKAKARRAALAEVMNFANQLGAKVAPLLADEG